MKLRAVVIGLGQRGRLWADTVLAHGSFTLVGAVDSDMNARDAAVRSLGLDPEVVFAEVDDAIRKLQPDVAIIVSPETFHMEHATKCLEHGVAILVEKPLTLEIEDSLRLVDLAETRGLALVVGQNYRYMRLHRTIRALIQEGRLGDVGMILTQYYRPDHPCSPFLAALDHRILWGMSIHHIDALRWVLGREVTSVSARVFNLPWGKGPNGASVQALLSFDGGIQATYVASYESSGHQFFEGGQEFYQRIVGSRATLHAFHRWLVLCETDRFPRLVRRGPRKTSEEHVLLDQLEEAIVKGIEPECSGRDNLGTLAVMDAIVRSSENGLPIDPRTTMKNWTGTT